MFCSRIIVSLNEKNLPITTDLLQTTLLLWNWAPAHFIYFNHMFGLKKAIDSVNPPPASDA